MYVSEDKRQLSSQTPLNSFDQSKLSLFVNARTDRSKENSVEKEDRVGSQDHKQYRDTSRDLPGLWQEPIEEEAEEDQDYSKLKELEVRRTNQKVQATPQKSKKLKLNFSLWEKNDHFSSKRAVKRIFMSKSGVQGTHETLSSKHQANQGNTTIDSSDQNTTEKPRETIHGRKMSLMTEFSCSGGMSFLQ